MRKPLSEKTLQKRYQQLSLSSETTQLLHDYFLCFSNLYGVILVQKAWTVFRDIEGIGTVRRKDFYAFSGIAQREEQPYRIYEMKEVYAIEEAEDPGYRLIVNNKLVSTGYYRFKDIYTTIENQCGRPLYRPER